VLQPSGSEVQRPGTPLQPIGQTVPSQAAGFAPPAHVRSHAHESEQSMSRHDPLPEQFTLHLPLPQSRSRHELLPLHTIVQDFATEQSMPEVHAFATEHPIVQFHP
jgi:hypothetical protein